MEAKTIKKQLVIIGIVTLFVFVGLSGCNEISNPLTTDKTLPDGTKITGDINQIKIVSYQMEKKKTLYLNFTQNTGFKSVKDWEVPWELDISDINSNLSKRKYVCDNFCFQSNFDWTVTWYSDYTGFSYYGTPYTINGFRLDNNLSSWVVSGTAKNVGTNFLNQPNIIVNFYNTEGAWLAAATDAEDNIPSGYTWDFGVRYSGEFLNDVSHISFEVKASPFG